MSSQQPDHQRAKSLHASASMPVVPSYRLLSSTPPPSQTTNGSGAPPPQSPTTTPSRPLSPVENTGGKGSADSVRMALWEERSVLSSKNEERVDKLSRLLSSHSLSPFPSSSTSTSSTSSPSLKPIQEQQSASAEISLPSGRIIDTSHAFYLWFDQMGKQLEEEEERIYVNYIHRLEEYQGLCDELMNELDSAILDLKGLQEQHQRVSGQANALREACHIIMNDKRALVAIVQAIQEKLDAYDRLEEVASLVEHHLQKPALHSDLISLMVTLDQCATFIHHSHGYYHSEVYRTKFQQVHSRAIALIKLFVVSNMRSHTSALSRELKAETAERSNRENTQQQIQATMRSMASILRPIFIQIEKRSRQDGYHQLLVDCRYTYFQERRRLVGPILAHRMDQLTTEHQQTLISTGEVIPGGLGLAEVVRRGCGLVVQTAVQEHQLVELFFHHPGDELPQLLHSLANIVYEAVRPLILKRPFDQLCAVASVIKSELMEEQLARRPDVTAPVSPVFQRMLQDVQERLSFLVEVFIRNEISGYLPSDYDLAYPDRLLSSSNGSLSPSSSPNGVKMDERSGKEGEVEIMQRKWYPPLGKALMLLSKVYGVLDKSIFEEIANDIVSDCTVSLLSAATQVSTRSGESHGSLFLIKHLVILREQISPFDVEFSRVERRLDFSSSFTGIFGLSAAVTSFLQGKWSSGWRSVWDVLQSTTPKVLDSKTNSKRDVEKELMRAVDRFVSTNLHTLLAPLIAFLTKASAFLTVRSTPESAKTAEGKQQLNRQPFAQAQQLAKVIQDMNKRLAENLPQVLEVIALYLAEDCPSSQMGLHNTLASAIAQQLNRFYSLVEKYFSKEEIEGCGLPSRVDVEVSVLGYFPEEVSSVIVQS